MKINAFSKLSIFSRKFLFIKTFYLFLPFLSLRYVKHYSQWLPPNHFYICDVELTLTQAIGAGDPKNLQSISDDLLQMKIDLCQKLLKIFGTLAAGRCLFFKHSQFRWKFPRRTHLHIFHTAESRCLGALHFELHAAMAELGRRGMQNKDNCFRLAIEESLKSATETVRLLQHEPIELSEGQICAQAKANIESLKVILASTAPSEI